MLLFRRICREFLPVFLGIVFCLSFGLVTPAVAQEMGNYFDALQKRLISDGYDESLIHDLYSQPDVGFEIRGVSLFLRHTEAKLDYDQFTTSTSIDKARNYMKNHAAGLSAAEQAYGVDKTVVTAIILVETRLGTVVGGRSIINSLSTMAALSDRGVRDSFWDRVADRSDMPKDQFEKWADRRSVWAYEELKAFLTYTDRESIQPWTIAGSYAGALGIAQFMPTNALALAKDGNSDGKINLFDHADAIASIANYLKYHGWKSGMSDEQSSKVIYRYNHSKYYVNTILKISKLLKG